MIRRRTRSAASNPHQEASSVTEGHVGRHASRAIPLRRRCSTRGSLRRPPASACGLGDAECRAAWPAGTSNRGRLWLCRSLNGTQRDLPFPPEAGGEGYLCIDAFNLPNAPLSGSVSGSDRRFFSGQNKSLWYFVMTGLVPVIHAVPPARWCGPRSWMPGLRRARRIGHWYSKDNFWSGTQFEYAVA